MNIFVPNLPTSCGGVLGGLSKLHIIPVQSVISIPDPVEYIVAEPMVLANGTVMAEIKFPSGAAEFTENQASEDQGEYFKQKLTVFIPKDTPLKAEWINNLAKLKYFILIYSDNNGFRKIIGTSDAPLRFSSETETGKTASNKNGSTLSFAGESLDKAFFYLSNPSEGNNSGSGDPVTIKKGNGEVVAVVQPGQTFIINSGFSWGFNII